MYHWSQTPPVFLKKIGREIRHGVATRLEYICGGLISESCLHFEDPYDGQLIDKMVNAYFIGESDTGRI